MTRRGLGMLLMAGLASAAVVGVLALMGTFAGGAPVNPHAPVAVTVDPGSARARIPPGFLGLSIEYWAVESYAGKHPTAINPVFVQLVRNLMPGGDGSLRIGGVTTDHTYLPIRGYKPSPGLWYKLNPDRLEVMRALADAVGARLILGITFEADSRKLAAAEGQAMLDTIGASRIAAFELGNEPELYGDPYFGWYTRDGQNVTGRPADYDMAALTTDFARVSSGLPTSVPLAGPAVGAENWLSTLNQFIDGVPRLGMVTIHRYPFEACSVNPASLAYPTIARMLSPLGTTEQAQAVVPYLRVAHAHGLPLRIGEMNNIACGSPPGFPNTFVMALWVLEALYADAQVGVDGVNIHTWPGAIYNLFKFKKHAGVWSGTVEPEYYGLDMFAQGAVPGSHLISASSGNPAVPTWATRAPDGSIRVTLVNNDTTSRHRVEVSVKGAVGPAAVERLLGPSPTATSGVTLGGQSFGVTTTGLLPGPSLDPPIAPVNGRYSIVLPPASAALLTLS